MTHIKMGVQSNTDSAQEFIQAWKRAEAGLPLEEPIERLYFEDVETLLKTLTPGRYRLLKTLHQIGASSIRALSKAVGRNYKNVHRDVMTLTSAGLMLKDEDGRFSAPWDAIISELPL